MVFNIAAPPSLFLGPTHRFLCSHGVYVGDSNVLTRAIVFNWVVIRLTLIVTICATFLSTDLYVFEVLVLSYNKLSEGKIAKQFMSSAFRRCYVQ